MLENSMAQSAKSEQGFIDRELENYLDKCEVLNPAILPTLDADYAHRN